jgi:hypothetical protein
MHRDNIAAEQMGSSMTAGQQYNGARHRAARLLA